jgi:hypothetical protein
MLKFAPKNNRQVLLAIQKEKKIFIYKTTSMFVGQNCVNIPVSV